MLDILKIGFQHPNLLLLIRASHRHPCTVVATCSGLFSKLLNFRVGNAKGGLEIRSRTSASTARCMFLFLIPQIECVFSFNLKSFFVHSPRCTTSQFNCINTSTHPLDAVNVRSLLGTPVPVNISFSMFFGRLVRCHDV